MTHRPERSVQRILDTLHRHRTMTIESLVSALPDISWNCIFHTVDELRRGGRIVVHRRGFEYEVSLPGSLPQCSPPAA